MIIKFPKYIGQRYYNTHFVYVLNILKEAPEVKISMEYLQPVGSVGFDCFFDEKRVVFNFSDDPNGFGDGYKISEYINRVGKNTPIFKFHYSIHIDWNDNVIPFTPVSFNNWQEYRILKDKIKYRADGYISSRQRCYAGATERRQRVQQILGKLYNNVNIKQIPQLNYWLDINNCFLGVFVPGYCNNMLDRGQLQWMAFGGLTISPDLPEKLPFGKYLIPDVHYVKCSDDYSDLGQKIEWCRENKDKCIEIGNNAKTLFGDCGTPESLWNWIKSKI